MERPDPVKGAGTSPAAGESLRDLSPEETGEAVRIASELYAQERSAAARSEQQEALINAAEEAGLPAEYLDRAARLIRERRGAESPWPRRGRNAFWVTLVALLLLGVLVTAQRRWGARAPAPAVPVPPARTADVPAVLAPLEFSTVNLGRARTHRMDEPMLSAGNDLASLAGRTLTLRGVPFRFDGLVMIGPGQTGTADTLFSLPRRVEGIRVGSRADRLYFLHGAHYNPGNGLKIGSYVVHYADGSQVEIPVRSGVDVADWWSFPGQVATNARVAWTGQNAASSRWAATNGPPDLGLQLFMKVWANPYPEREIGSLEVRTGDQEPGPGAPALFLAAVSAGRDRDGR